MGTSTSGGTTLNYIPQLHIVYDYNDANLAAVSSLVEYGNYRTYKFNGPRTFKIYPRSEVTLYRTAATNAYGNAKKGQWIDTQFADVPHYGMKFAVDNINNSLGVLQTVSFKIRLFYYFSMKQVK